MDGVRGLGNPSFVFLFTVSVVGIRKYGMGYNRCTQVWGGKVMLLKPYVYSFS